MSELFSAAGDGLAVALPPEEADVFRRVVSEIRAVVSAEQRPDFAYRLFPPAYVDDDEAQTEFARLMTEDLVRSKLEALATVEATFGRGKVKRGRWTLTLTTDEAQAWLAVLNDARLTLGTKLGVTEEEYAAGFDEAAPDAHARAVYHWLGWLEESLVDALLA